MRASVLNKVAASVVKPNDAVSGYCMSVHDGDTMHFRLDLRHLLSAYLEVDVRVHGINAPELATPEGLKARDFATQALLGKWCVLVFKGADKYGGRHQAEIYYDGEQLPQKNFGQVMIAAKQAVPMVE